MKLSISLLLCAGLILRPAFAAAECLYECEGSLCYDFGNHSDMCMKTRAECQAKCSNKRSYGAIAYSADDGGYGWSDHWDYQDKAEETATKNCSEHGSNCEVIVWFYNGCGAVAADGKIVTWGRDSTKRKAEATALSECGKAEGKNCEIKASQCSLD